MFGTAGSDEHGEYDLSRGGFLVPSAFSPEVLKVEAEMDPSAGLTRNIPMTAPILNIPARTDKNHTTSVTGGLRVYWGAETQAATTSRTQVESVQLVAKNMTGAYYVTEELLSDSPTAVQQMLADSLAEEFPSEIFNAKIRGTGAGQYEGILNSPALVSVSAETGQAADTIIYDNIINMMARLWKRGAAKIMWLANHEAFPQIAKLTQGSGATATPIFNVGANGAPSTLGGYPIYFTEYASAIGDLGDIVLVNWNEYLEGVLQTTQMSESVHVRFLENERCFKAWTRRDGRGWWRSALTPKKGSSTLSPFVTLAAR
jgi:HK97 family phage major capsid protein